MNIQVRYCTNYNGCDITIDNAAPSTEELSVKAESVEAIVTDYAFDACDEDGYFQGDEDELKQFIVGTVHQVFGKVHVEVEIDSISS